MDPSVADVGDLFDQAPCGLLVTALDGTILKVNATFCTWIGLPQESLVQTKKLQDLFTMGGRIFHQTHWVPSLQLQGSLSEVKFDLRHSDGRLVPMILNAQRRKRAGGQVDEIAAFVAQDRNRYEKELLLARKRADELLQVERDAQQLLRDRALFAEQMVGIVSHDLRNPLSAILMGVRLLERADNERRVRVLGHVRDSAERAQRLIEELLDFTQARIGSGLSVSLRPVQLHALAERTVEELRLSFPDRQIQLLTAGPGSCTADPDRLAQLLGNLVGNAATYGRAGSPIVVRSEISGTLAMLAVHNEGEPISEELLGHVFEPMVRGVPGSSNIRSVGLGLFIVNEIAKAHGGRMEARSASADGTTFSLHFSAGPE